MSFNLQQIGQCVAVAAVLSIGGAARPSAGPRPDGDRQDREGRIRHVLLISIDGMHALDYENCVRAGTCARLAELGDNGVTYTARWWMN
jgi:hypothetical protein